MRRPDSNTQHQVRSQRAPEQHGASLARALFLSLACLGAAGAAAGCSDRESWSAHQAALTVPLPAVGQFAILATRSVTMSDRAQVSGGHLGLAPGAPGALSVGMDARAGVGAVSLAQRMTLLDRATVG